MGIFQSFKNYKADVVSDRIAREEADHVFAKLREFLKKEEAFAEKRGGRASVDTLQPSKGGFLVYAPDVLGKTDCENLYFHILPTQEGLNYGFGSSESNQRGVIYLPILLNPYDLQYASTRLRPDCFRHEFIHYLDAARRGFKHLRSVPQDKFNPTEDDWSAYFNNPLEMNAYFQEAVPIIEKALNAFREYSPQQWHDRAGTFDDFVFLALTMFETNWLEALTKENSRKLMRRVYALYQEMVRLKRVPSKSDFKDEVKALKRQIDQAYRRGEYGKAERLDVRLEAMLEKRDTFDEETDWETDDAEDLYGSERFKGIPTNVDAEDFSSLEEELARLWHSWISGEALFEDTEALKEWQQQFISPANHQTLKRLLGLVEQGKLSYPEATQEMNRLNVGSKTPPFSEWPPEIQALTRSKKILADHIYNLVVAGDVGDWWKDQPKSRSELSDEQLIMAAKDAYDHWHTRRQRQRTLGKNVVPDWAKGLGIL